MLPEALIFIHRAFSIDPPLKEAHRAVSQLKLARFSYAWSIERMTIFCLRTLPECSCQFWLPIQLQTFSLHFGDGARHISRVDLLEWIDDASIAYAVR